MLSPFFQTAKGPFLAGGFVFTLLLTFIAIRLFRHKLPKDGGRDYAYNGQLSQGEPRGAGVILISCFALAAALFMPLTTENMLYIALTVVIMITGYLDDKAEVPWEDYVKGILDLLIAGAGAALYVLKNGSELRFAFFAESFVLHPVLYWFLATVLLWGAINVVNCSDGVDGLSSVLGIIVLLSVYTVGMSGAARPFFVAPVLLSAVFTAYLWFNAHPSKLLMGDAGSRALGFFIGLAFLKTGRPLLFLPMALVFILDGGLGLLKVFLLRYLKIPILKNTRTPLHDHVRTHLGWSDGQTMVRFSAVQLAITIALLLARQPG